MLEFKQVFKINLRIKNKTQTKGWLVFDLQDFKIEFWQLAQNSPKNHLIFKKVNEFKKFAGNNNFKIYTVLRPNAIIKLYMKNSHKTVENSEKHNAINFYELKYFKTDGTIEFLEFNFHKLLPAVPENLSKDTIKAFEKNLDLYDQHIEEIMMKNLQMFENQGYIEYFNQYPFMQKDLTEEAWGFEIVMEKTEVTRMLISKTDKYIRFFNNKDSYALKTYYIDDCKFKNVYHSIGTFFKFQYKKNIVGFVLLHSRKHACVLELLTKILKKKTIKDLNIALNKKEVDSNFGLEKFIVHDENLKGSSVQNSPWYSSINMLSKLSYSHISVFNKDENLNENSKVNDHSNKPVRKFSGHIEKSPSQIVEDVSKQKRHNNIFDESVKKRVSITDHNFDIENDKRGQLVQESMNLKPKMNTFKYLQEDSSKDLIKTKIFASDKLKYQSSFKDILDKKQDIEYFKGQKEIERGFSPNLLGENQELASDFNNVIKDQQITKRSKHLEKPTKENCFYKEMKSLRLDVKNTLNLKVFVTSWNQASTKIPNNVGDVWLKDAFNADIIAIGLQEGKYSSSFLKFNALFVDTGKYYMVKSMQLWSISLLIYARIVLKHYIHDKQTSFKKTGQFKVCGNKGAVMISFKILDIKFCFVNCHQASGPDRLDARIESTWEILKDLRENNNRQFDLPSLSDYFFWMGDFNWRVTEEFYEVQSKVLKGNLKEILEFDQQKEVKEWGLFSQLKEGPINFRPTYRRLLHTNDSFSNKKGQSPSWTDRIVYCSKPNCNIKQISYTSIEDQFGSDHRPVVGQFLQSFTSLVSENNLLNSLDNFEFGKIEVEYISLNLKLTELQNLCNMKYINCNQGQICITFLGNDFLENSPETQNLDLPAVWDHNQESYSLQWESKELPKLYQVYAERKFYLSQCLNIQVVVNDNKNNLRDIVAFGSIDLSKIFMNESKTIEMKPTIYLYTLDMGSITLGLKYKLINIE